jgi:hypothetical protein
MSRDLRSSTTIVLPWMYTCSEVRTPDLNLDHPRREKNVMYSSG